jgi:hypothetical protein
MTRIVPALLARGREGRAKRCRRPEQQRFRRHRAVGAEFVAIVERRGRASSQASSGLFLIGCGPGAAGAVAGRRDGQAATMGAAARAAGMDGVLRMLAPPVLGRAGAWALGAQPGSGRRATGAPALGSGEVSPALAAGSGRRFLGSRRVARGGIRAPGRSPPGPPRQSGRSPPEWGGGSPRPLLPPAGWLCSGTAALPAAARNPGGTGRSVGR